MYCGLFKPYFRAKCTHMHTAHRTSAQVPPPALAHHRDLPGGRSQHLLQGSASALLQQTTAPHPAHTETALPCSLRMLCLRQPTHSTPRPTHFSKRPTALSPNMHASSRWLPPHACIKLMAAPTALPLPLKPVAHQWWGAQRCSACRTARAA